MSALGEGFGDVEAAALAQHPTGLAQCLIHHLHRKVMQRVEEDHQIEALGRKVESLPASRQKAQIGQGFTRRGPLQLLRRRLETDGFLKPAAKERAQQGAVTATDIECTLLCKRNEVGHHLHMLASRYRAHPLLLCLPLELPVSA